MTLPVKSTIDAFGGMLPCSKALGHTNHTTVQGWLKSGRIPRWRETEIKEAAERLGISLPSESSAEPPSDSDGGAGNAQEVR